MTSDYEATGNELVTIREDKRTALGTRFLGLLKNVKKRVDTVVWTHESEERDGSIRTILDSKRKPRAQSCGEIYSRKLAFHPDLTQRLQGANWASSFHAIEGSANWSEAALNSNSEQVHVCDHDPNAQADCYKDVIARWKVYR